MGREGGGYQTAEGIAEPGAVATALNYKTTVIGPNYCQELFLNPEHSEL